MSATKPGLRPWTAKLENRIARDGVDVFDAEGERVFYVTPDDTKEIANGQIVECLSPEQKTNLAHVLRCVNAHDDLLAALEDTIRLELGENYEGSNPVLAENMKRARAAIAKARGGGK